MGVEGNFYGHRQIQHACAGPFFVPTLTYSFAGQKHAIHFI